MGNKKGVFVEKGELYYINIKIYILCQNGAKK